jgi:hypothetical protein
MLVINTCWFCHGAAHIFCIISAFRHPNDGADEISSQISTIILSGESTKSSFTSSKSGTVPHFWGMYRNIMFYEINIEMSNLIAILRNGDQLSSSSSFVLGSR